MTLDAAAATDDELILSAQKGNGTAFAQIAERHFGVVYAIAYARLGHREAAEDLAQEVFLRAYLYLDRFRQPVPLAAWLARTTKNLAIDWIRQKQHASRLLPMVPLQDLAEEPLDQSAKDGLETMLALEQDQLVRDAILRLPVEQREVILLHFSEGLSQSDIANRLGVFQTTVGRRLKKALKAMKGMLEPVLFENVVRESMQRESAEQGSAQRESNQRKPSSPLKPSRAAISRVIALGGATAALSVTAKAALIEQAGGAAWLAIASAAATESILATGKTAALLKTFTTALAAGGKIMTARKAVTAVVALAALLAGGAYLFNGKPLGRKQPQPQVAVAPTSSTLSTSGATTSSSLAASITPPPKPQKAEDQFAQLPPDQLPDAKGEPLWGVEIGPVSPGKYDYRIVVDGENKWSSQASSLNASEQFTLPPAPDQKLQKQVGPNRIQFYHIGRIRRFVWFISSLTEDEWGMREMRPLNEAAKANLQEIAADPALSKAEGVVVDSANRLISNARVLVKQTNQFERVAQCNEAGQFKLNRLPRANLAFSGRGWGYAISKGINAGPNAPADFPPLKIVLQRGTIVTGRIRDELGKPVAMASVSARADQGQVSRYVDRPQSAARSDKEGIYVLDAMESGRYGFQVSEEKIGTISRNATIPNQATPFQLDFTLINGGTIAIKAVRAGGNGNVPANGVLFRANLTGPSANSLAEQQVVFYIYAVTDDQGHLEFQGVPYGRPITVQALENMNRKISEQVLTLEKGKPAPTLEFHLPPVAVVYGRVQDLDGKPIAGADVFWRDQNGSTDPATAPKVVTNAEGKFTCDNLSSSNEYFFTAIAKGYGPAQTSSISAASDEELIITLKPGITIKGRVIFGADSQPVADITLHRFKPFSNATEEVKTSASGQFTCEDLAAGNHMFEGTKYRPEGTLVVSEDLKIEDVGLVQEKTLVANMGLVLRGKAILQETGEPVADVNISMSMENRSNMRQIAASTSSDGKFEILDLSAAKYRVMIQKAGLSFVKGPNQEIDERYWNQQTNLMLTIEKDKDPEPLELVFTKGGTVTGQVVDATDKPVAGCWVYAAKSNTSTPYGPNGVDADDQGKFSISGIDFGAPIKLRARCQQGQGSSEAVTLTKEKPQCEVQIKLGVGDMLKGNVKDGDGKPLGDAVISFVFEENGKTNTGTTRSDALGNYYIESTVVDTAADSNAKCKVAAALKGYETQTQDVHLQKGKPAECNFVLKKGNTYKGILVDLNKKELAGVHVLGNSDSRSLDSRTSYDGSFDLGSSSEKISLTFDLNNSGGSIYRNMTYATGEFTPTEAETVFVLPLGAVVHGRLVDNITKQSVHLQAINIHAEMGDISSQIKPEGAKCILKSFNTNQKDAPLADGVFEIRNLPIGQMRLSLSAPSIATKSLVSAVDLQTDLGDIPVSQGLIGEGRVIDAQTGKPCTFDRNKSDGYYFSGGESSPRMDQYPDTNGRFRISGITLDVRELTLNTSSYLLVKVPVGKAVDGVVNLGDIRLDKGESLICTLKLPGDVPISGAGLRIEQPAGQYKYINVQHGNKKFTVTGLLPGQAKINIGALDPPPAANPRQYGIEKEVTIVKGTPLEVEFTLVEQK